MGKKRRAVETKAPKSIGSKQAWRLMDRGSSVAASAAARDVPALAWRIATGRKPPKFTNNPDANTREVLAWAFIGGGFAELMRVVVKRSTATYWVKSTGHLPPGMKPVKKSAGDPEPDPADEPIGD